MNIAVILAGGVGSRVGAGMPKQFVKILDKPVIVYTIEAFQKHEDIDAIEVVCVKSHIDYMQELVDTRPRWHLYPHVSEKPLSCKR